MYARDGSYTENNRGAIIEPYDKPHYTQCNSLWQAAYWHEQQMWLQPLQCGIADIKFNTWRNISRWTVSNAMTWSMLISTVTCFISAAAKSSFIIVCWSIWVSSCTETGQSSTDATWQMWDVLMPFKRLGVYDAWLALAYLWTTLDLFASVNWHAYRSSRFIVHVQSYLSLALTICCLLDTSATNIMIVLGWQGCHLQSFFVCKFADGSMLLWFIRPNFYHLLHRATRLPPASQLCAWHPFHFVLLPLQLLKLDFFTNQIISRAISIDQIVTSQPVRSVLHICNEIAVGLGTYVGASIKNFFLSAVWSFVTVRVYYLKVQ